MSLSNTTLSAIQQAGAAVFAADLELKTAVREYADRVHMAMASNPYSLGNDTLFENWKVVARLSQAMTAIEEELKKVYHVAAELVSDDQPLLVQVALEAPAPVKEPLVEPDNLTPTDVVDKSKKRKAQPAVKKASAKTAPAPKTASNVDKLMAHLRKVLNKNEFTALNQTVAAQKTGIPLGSMTAAIKKALENGLILVGPSGLLKLAQPQ